MTEIIVLTTCPKCHRKQKAVLAKKHKCVYCGCVFTLFPKKQRPRIEKIIRGTLLEYNIMVRKILGR